MAKKYQSEILMVLHQDAEALHRIGVISDAEMREWDEDCLVAKKPAGKATRAPSAGVAPAVAPAAAYAAGGR